MSKISKISKKRNFLKAGAMFLTAATLFVIGFVVIEGNFRSLNSAIESSPKLNLPVSTAQEASAASTDNSLPYPRGTAPAYGYMGCKDGNTCLTDGATLIHLGWEDIVNFTNSVNKGKALGISKNLVATGGAGEEKESFWKSARDSGITDNDFYGVYFKDEPKKTADIINAYKFMKKYFPNAVAGDYLGDMENGNSKAFIPGLDIAFFTTYTKFHDRPHAWVYGNLIANGPAWTKAGKKVFATTELFGSACVVTPKDPDLSTAQKVSDRQTSQIVMSILGGAQGIFSYSNDRGKGTPCETGWVAFKDKYFQVWPWIMKGDRKILTTNVTSGTKSITSSPGGKISAVTSYMFTDASGKKLIVSSNMLDFTETKGIANNATITGVPNGIYDVLWENRTITVVNGTINDIWQPYGYHFYQLR